MKKNNIIAVLLALFTVLFLSEFKVLETICLMPSAVWFFPLFGFYYLSVQYFSNAFKTKLKMAQKISVILFGGVGMLSLLYMGFSIWKSNSGNIFAKEEYQTFQINLKNVFFWVVYQSYLMLFFFSSFKQLVTIDQK
ncbi:hypothetical protein AXE80_13125 [Wenyingzhuangia fucanilytica]|uniref:Uncharacterized protein n=1 Tax=Wenyingzhuangia fucanilytica TaxID=1790137 RepID=A0A1B1Y8R1_9FLAO|nr:hypothetical protein [Wenyingzhuangia fucanilytica]ANW97170.1 hypothetical protein AXE80_13125 [Wenyingzhuangia fucanilytica]